MLARFSIGVQIGIGFAIAVCLMVVGGTLTTINASAMSARADNVRRLGHIDHTLRLLLESMVDQETGMRAYVASGKEGFLGPLKAGRRAQPDLATAVQMQVQAYPDLAGPVAAAVAATQQLDTYFDGQTELVHTGHQAVAIAKLGDGKTAFDAFRAAVATTDTTIAAQADAATAAFESSQHALEVGQLIATSLSAVILIALGLGIGRSITGRLKVVTAGLQSMVDADFAALAQALRALSSGDLTVTFSSQRTKLAEQGRDEIARLVTTYNSLALGLGEMGTQFTTAAGRLRDALRQVASVVHVTAKASSDVSMATVQSSAAVEEIAKTTGSVAGGVREQADQIRTSGAAIEELSRSARQIATGAGDQSRSVQGTADAVRGLDAEISGTVDVAATLTATVSRSIAQASAGSEAVGQTRTAMNQIQTESERALGGIRSLAERSNAVEAIISTIEEIADQTNLLALNAAIEAARAGEHGRGFAVVADEVRKLAERAAVSTREIGSILSGIRKETVAAESAMSTSAESTRKGLELASTASKSLAELTLAIEEQRSAAAELANRAQAMRRVSLDVTDNIASVSAVIDQNATASSEMSTTTDLVTSAMVSVSSGTASQSAAAEELSAAAAELALQMMNIKDTASELNRESGKLAELIAGFRLDNGPEALTGGNIAQRALRGDRYALT